MSEFKDVQDDVCTLPKEMAWIKVDAYTIPAFGSQAQGTIDVVDDESRMWLDRNADSILFQVFILFTPVRKHFFFPLPAQHILIIWWPCTSDPNWVQ